MTGISAISSAVTTETLDAFAPTTGVVDRARARLSSHADVWRDRPLIREIYSEYHQAIASARSRVTGVDLEVGAGHGSFAERFPEVIACDLVPCPWLDCAADATRLPFRDESLANLIMIDVLHHIAEPAKFLAEASRTLAPGGRILLVEPYVSPVSWIAWRFFHEEDIDMGIDPWSHCRAPDDAGERDPWESNIGLPTLLFWRHLARIETLFPELMVTRRDRFNLLLYPLSGGFEQRRLVPLPLVPLVRAVERWLIPLAPMLAFRCLVVIEKARRSDRSRSRGGMT